MLYDTAKNYINCPIWKCMYGNEKALYFEDSICEKPILSGFFSWTKNRKREKLGQIWCSIQFFTSNSIYDTLQET